MAIKEYEYMLECLGFNMPHNVFIGAAYCLKLMNDTRYIYSRKDNEEKCQKSWIFISKIFPNLFGAKRLDRLEESEKLFILQILNEIVCCMYESAKSYISYCPGPNIFVNAFISLNVAHALSQICPSYNLVIFPISFCVSTAASVAVPIIKYFEALCDMFFQCFVGKLLITNLNAEDSFYVNESLFYISLGFSNWGKNIKSDYYYRKCIKHMDETGMGESESAHIIRSLFYNLFYLLKAEFLISPKCVSCCYENV